MQDNRSGVQGLLTLNYDSHQDTNGIVANASQLSAGDPNAVVLLEYNQEKNIAEEQFDNREIHKYSINADDLISLIKEHGTMLK